METSQVKAVRNDQYIKLCLWISYPRSKLLHIAVRNKDSLFMQLHIKNSTPNFLLLNIEICRPNLEVVISLIKGSEISVLLHL